MKKVNEKRKVYTVRIFRSSYDVNVLADSLDDAVATMRDEMSWANDVEKCVGVGLAKPLYDFEKEPQINYYQK
jgi:hypothetical protein